MTETWFALYLLCVGFACENWQVNKDPFTLEVCMEETNKAVDDLRASILADGVPEKDFLIHAWCIKKEEYYPI